VKKNHTLRLPRCATLGLLAAAALCAQQAGTEVTMQWVIRQPGGKTGSKQEEFSRQAKPGPGKELRVFVMANRECTVSFAGFTRDGQLVYGLPETVRLAANVPKELPVSKKWTFDGHEQLAEIDAVIADTAAADYKRYADLVDKMSRPGISVEVLQAQAGALRGWLNEKLQSNATAHDLTPKENPAEIGGLARGDLKGEAFLVPERTSSVVRMRIP
jgi:hypothetical protein